MLSKNCLMQILSTVWSVHNFRTFKKDAIKENTLFVIIDTLLTTEGTLVVNLSRAKYIWLT